MPRIPSRGCLRRSAASRPHPAPPPPRRCARRRLHPESSRAGAGDRARGSERPASRRWGRLRNTLHPLPASGSPPPCPLALQRHLGQSEVKGGRQTKRGCRLRAAGREGALGFESLPPPSPPTRALQALTVSCPLHCSGSARDSASCWQSSAAVHLEGAALGRWLLAWPLEHSCPWACLAAGALPTYHYHLHPTGTVTGLAHVS